MNRRYGLLKNEYTVKFNEFEDLPNDEDELRDYLIECENDPVFSVSKSLFRDLSNRANSLYMGIVNNCISLYRRAKNSRELKEKSN